MIPSEFPDLDPETAAKWGHIYMDPKCKCNFTPTTGVLWAEEQERAKVSVQQMAIPTMMIEA